MSIRTLLFCLCLFVIAAVPRMYRINNPVADWHSWRQADTAAVSRNFIKDGFTPLLPRSDSFYALNDTEGYNTNRYFLAEFPLYNIITYPFYVKFGVHEEIARGISIFFSSLTAVALFLLAKRISGTRVGVIAGLVFALLPFNIYFGRVIMPDPLHVFLGVLALLLVLVWAEKKNVVWAGLAGLAFAGTILTKPYGLVLMLPISILLLFGYSSALKKLWHVLVFATFAFGPFLLWRWHIQQYPVGMFGTDWLFNQGNIRFTGAFFRWLVFDRMNRLMFATGGFVLFWLGLSSISKSRKEGWFLLSWLAAILTFFCVIARGNVTHDYYQLPLVPVGAYLIAKGVELLLWSKSNFGQKLLNISITGILLTLMLAFGWFENRGNFNVNHWEIVHAGQAADQLLPKDAKVIAPYDKDPAFLYQTNRFGWTLGGGKIAEFISQGATHLVAVNLDADVQEWMAKCSILKQTSEYVIVDLRNCKEPAKVEASKSTTPSSESSVINTKLNQK